MAEKRLEKRKRKRKYVKFSCNGLEFSGNTSNLSPSGLFIRTQRPFRPGVPVKILLEVEKDRQICLQGICVRATRYGFACKKNGMGILILSKCSDYDKLLNDLS